MKKRDRDWFDHSLYAAVYIAAGWCAFKLWGGYGTAYTALLVAAVRIR